MLSVRVDDELAAAVVETADRLGLSKSQFYRVALEQAVERARMRPDQRLQVQKFRHQGLSPGARYCNHPLQYRTVKAGDGSSQCLACGSVIARVG